jgi:ABC-type polysaccharide/polyol phosphate transport system ATPase subunit
MSQHPGSIPTEPVIVVKHVSKSYQPKAQQISLRHEANKFFSQALGRDVPRSSEIFWALRDISFTVQAGEAVALVGRNGSGKTTLLRVLSGITHAAEGEVQVTKRFATLISLGAGFNLERTGRQNIFLNAAIQGVPPKQVENLVDDIIGFSELGEFIDVPVKRYSSGMITRLGFSIAVHIFPDIIFIDEVLAVGDAGFQEKCLERILAMRAEGRTLIFVSHEPGTVRKVCDRAIWLHHGHLRMDAPTDMVLTQYKHMLEAHEDNALPALT